MVGRRVSRRELLSLSAAAATSVIAASCAPQATPAPKEVIKEVIVEKTVEVPVTPTPAPPEPVAFDCWTRFGEDQSGKALEAVNDEWNKANPLIQVKMVHTPAGGDSVVAEKLITAIVSGAAPAVAHIDMFVCPSWSARGAWEDLTDLLDLAGMDLDAEYFPWAADESRYNGRVFGLTMLTGHNAFVWNRDLFSEVGLDPERPPQSAEELLEYADKLDKKEGGRYTRLGFDPGSQVLPWALGYHWLGCKTDPVADFYDFSTMKCTCNHPRIVEALEWKVWWCEHYGVSELDTFRSALGWNDQDPIGLGLVAMQMAGNWVHAVYDEYFPDLKWGVARAPIPAKYGGTSPGSCMGSEGLAMPRGTKSPIREAAWEYLRWMCGADAQRQFCQQSDQLPTRKDLSEDPYFRRDAQMIAWMDLMPCGFNRPSIAEGQLLWSELLAAEDKAVHGLGTPKQLLDEVAAKIDEAMEKWQM